MTGWSGRVGDILQISGLRYQSDDVWEMLPLSTLLAVRGQYWSDAVLIILLLLAGGCCERLVQV